MKHESQNYLKDYSNDYVFCKVNPNNFLYSKDVIKGIIDTRKEFSAI